MMDWNRLRDPQVWVYFFSFAKLSLAAVGVDLAPTQWTTYEEVFNALCGLLVAFGIFRYNPQQGEDT